MTIDGRPVDIRVSTMETIWGEKVVLRLLDRTRSLVALPELGLQSGDRSGCTACIDSPYGTAGGGRAATGAGKTTTLYAALSELDSRDAEHHDHRGPGRVPLREHQPGPDQPAGRDHLRQRPQGDPAPGPRHHPGGRGPGCRDRPDRDPIGAHRPPRALLHCTPPTRWVPSTASWTWASSPTWSRQP